MFVFLKFQNLRLLSFSTRMALQLRTKLRTLTNPSFVHLFSTSSSDQSDSSDPTEPNPQSHSSSASDYFSDVKPSLKQQSPQQQQQQSRFNALNAAFIDIAQSRPSRSAYLDQIRKDFLKFRRRSVGPNPTESNSAPGQRSATAPNPSQISFQKPYNKRINIEELRESLVKQFGGGEDKLKKSSEYEGDEKATILNLAVEDKQTTLFSNQPSNIIMVDQQQDAKKKVTYEQWTKEESDLLLELMVEAATWGWRDNGILTKQTVEERILPVLNERLGCHKTYNNYQSRLKWFKNRWISYSTLMCFNSGFAFDSTTKKFTASDEVWEEYFKAHPKDTYLRHRTFRDYEDLEIVIGNGVAVGKNSTGLGSVIDARTLAVGESRDVRIENFDYDVDSDAFIRLNPNDPSFQSTLPLQAPKTLEVPIQRTKKEKRNRTEYEGSSSSIGNNSQSGIIERLDQIFTSFQGIYNILEKREREREYTIWDAIKDTPNLEEDTRFKAVELLDTKAKKDVFLKMSPKERSNWIRYKMRGL